MEIHIALEQEACLGSNHSVVSGVSAMGVIGRDVLRSLRELLLRLFDDDVVLDSATQSGGSGALLSRWCCLGGAGASLRNGRQ